MWLPVALKMSAATQSCFEPARYILVFLSSLDFISYFSDFATKMDKYSVLDLIGEGSFGRVFRGKDKQTGEIVALKLIPKIGHSEKDIKSLRCECKIQKELKHPNIVRMIDAFETDNEVISVAEYVPGELFRLFDQYKTETVGQRRLPEHRVQEIAGDLVSALHYLHSNRVLHRDIKPQNILLDTQGTAKLCDFGFARNLGLDTMG